MKKLISYLIIGIILGLLLITFGQYYIQQNRIASISSALGEMEEMPSLTTLSVKIGLITTSEGLEELNQLELDVNRYEQTIQSFNYVDTTLAEIKISRIRRLMVLERFEISLLENL